MTISTRPISHDFLYDLKAPKKTKGFNHIQKLININMENTRILTKIIDPQIKN